MNLVFFWLVEDQLKKERNTFTRMRIYAVFRPFRGGYIPRSTEKILDSFLKSFKHIYFYFLA